MPRSVCITEYMSETTKRELFRELLRVLKECRSIGYTAGYFRADLANSAPDALCMRYVMNEPSDGFVRLLAEGRLDLAVENAVWKFRNYFPPTVVKRAQQRLDAVGFDVWTQREIKGVSRPA
jgi:hypothetical protein